MAEYINLISHRKNPLLKSGDSVKGGNLSQEKAGTDILVGLKDLTFEGVNLKNIKGLSLALVLRVENGYRVFKNNIRVKDCLIHQEDVVPEPEPTEGDRISMALDDLVHSYGEQTVISKIAEKYELRSRGVI
jgi:hypothetical protein